MPTGPTRSWWSRPIQQDHPAGPGDHVQHHCRCQHQAGDPLHVPSRTGIGIEPATYVAGEHPNIAAIKEANSDISKIVETFSLVGDRLDIYSGNDDQIVPILSMGGAGCISVLSNVIPAETVAITQRFFAGDVAGAAQLQCRYMPLIRALFCESNPIPVKAAMAALGYCDNYLRLPLVPMEEDHYQGMLQRMRELGLPV
ncbi:MAG: dihydrodipicolinate synthase family protein [Evtepia gabavorous]